MSYERLGMNLRLWSGSGPFNDVDADSVALWRRWRECLCCVIQSLMERWSSRVQETTESSDTGWRCDHDRWYDRENFRLTRPQPSLPRSSTLEAAQVWREPSHAATQRHRGWTPRWRHWI